jgi:hypothetical protein
MLHAKDIAIDWVQVGTMMVVAQWLQGGSLADGSWQMNSLFTLLGFTAYQLSTRNFMTPTKWEGAPRQIADDTIKFGTMFVVSRMLAGGSMWDTDWLAGCFGTLIGFAVYNIVVQKYINGKELSYNPKLQMAINDWAKVGTMLTVARLISCESLFDAKWAVDSLAVILGFTTYDLVTSHIVDKIPL